MSHWEIDAPQTIEVDEVRELRASIVRGRLDVITHQEASTRIEVAEISGTPLEVTLENGTLRIRHRDEDEIGWLKRLTGMKNHHAIVSIAVPAGISVLANTVSGEGLVSGTSAETSLKTVSGSLMSDDTSGSLTVDTVSGEIIVRNHRGPLVAGTVSGEITASGELQTVKAKSVSGDLSFDLKGIPEELSSNGVSGELTVRVPSGLGVQLDAKSVSGNIILDDQRFSGTSPNVRVNSGPESPRMQVHSKSVSGNISIVREHGAA
ncbi:hypothetical protein UM93_07360 [Psychromicrobium lacuslunae]|uniref:DUF4097 domain-containing protein n=2 Tax=Psychromicrobium lacuslunae TaxID=1618207 RepID=A0A0D4BYH9_9MICC|nr:hypothetical protein UM93_07360 [Psychromicrobium lacuslunae]